MSTLLDSPYLTVKAGEALSANRVVKLSGARTVVYADAGEEGIGITLRPAQADEQVAIKLLNGPGSAKIEMAGSISANADIYVAADGKGSSSASGKKIGTALEAASGNGSKIEMILDRRADLSSGTGVIKLFDDFLHFTDADLWTLQADAGGAQAVIDGKGGLLSIASDGDDNDEAYIITTNELFKFATDKPLIARARVALTEANSDDANVIFGLVSGAGADALVDDGAGPPANYSGAVFYKVDGGTVWLAEASIATSQSAVTLSTDTFPGDGTYQELMIEFDPGSGVTDGRLYFYLDGALVGSVTSFDYTSATEMDVVAGCKAGGANPETLLVDFVLVEQAR